MHHAGGVQENGHVTSRPGDLNRLAARATNHCLTAAGRRPRRPQVTRRAPGNLAYGLAVVAKTSVRLVVLPEFARTKTGTKVFPIVASPS